MLYIHNRYTIVICLPLACTARTKVYHFLITTHQCEIARDDYLQAFQGENTLN